MSKWLIILLLGITVQAQLFDFQCINTSKASLNIGISTGINKNQVSTFRTESTWVHLFTPHIIYLFKDGEQVTNRYLQDDDIFNIPTIDDLELGDYTVRIHPSSYDINKDDGLSNVAVLNGLGYTAISSFTLVEGVNNVNLVGEINHYLVTVDITALNEANPDLLDLYADNSCYARHRIGYNIPGGYVNGNIEVHPDNNSIAYAYVHESVTVRSFNFIKSYSTDDSNGYCLTTVNSYEYLNLPYETEFNAREHHSYTLEAENEGATGFTLDLDTTFTITGG